MITVFRTKKRTLLFYASAPDLDQGFGKLIQRLTIQSPIAVQTTDGENAFGVMSRYANLDGRSILLLVNLRSEPVNVQLINKQGKVVNGYDKLNREGVTGDTIHLPIKNVRLIVLE